MGGAGVQSQSSPAKLTLCTPLTDHLPQDEKVHLARAVLDHTDLATALVSRTARLADTQIFNTRLEYEATPVTNQMSSGRCWLFASTNVIRYDIAQKLKVKDFQLSQVCML